MNQKNRITKENQRNCHHLIHDTQKKTVTQEQLDDWQDSNEYGVWVDGGRIDNADLSKTHPEDYANYFVSRLEKNAKNYGKHYYQVNLMTHAYFEKTYPLLKVD